MGSTVANYFIAGVIISPNWTSPDW